MNEKSHSICDVGKYLKYNTSKKSVNKDKVSNLISKESESKELKMLIRINASRSDAFLNKYSSRKKN